MTNRDRLLAPQLQKSGVWQDYARKIDQVLADMGIDDARAKLALLRSPLNSADAVVSQQGQPLQALASVERQERATLVKTADMLGFRYYNRDLLDSEAYLRLCMFLGQYYEMDKGTERFDDFMGFVANSAFQVISTWTQDYVTFYKEGDPVIGTPVYRGGPWYPTTHVVLRYGFGPFIGVDSASIIDFFYYFANINLVLWSVELVDDEANPMIVNVAGAATMDIWL